MDSESSTTSNVYLLDMSTALVFARSAWTLIIQPIQYGLVRQIKGDKQHEPT